MFMKLHYWTLTLLVSQTSTFITGTTEGSTGARCSSSSSTSISFSTSSSSSSSSDDSLSSLSPPLAG
nr:hypothetical protein [Tanacetum cinerariifolium]